MKKSTKTSISGNLDQVKGKLRKGFGKLTNDDIERAAGNRDETIGRIQERYNLSREEAEKRYNQVFSQT